jgi:hypothetical protein
MRLKIQHCQIFLVIYIVATWLRQNSHKRNATEDIISHLISYSYIYRGLGIGIFSWYYYIEYYTYIIFNIIFLLYLILYIRRNAFVCISRIIKAFMYVYSMSFMYLL